MTEVLATLGPCCGILRRGMNEPNVMHNGLCREKHDGCLGPTIYLVDLAEVERLRTELAVARADLAVSVGHLSRLAEAYGCEDFSTAIDAALAAKGD